MTWKAWVPVSRNSNSVRWMSSAPSRQERRFELRRWIRTGTNGWRPSQAATSTSRGPIIRFSGSKSIQADGSLDSWKEMLIAYLWWKNTTRRKADDLRDSHTGRFEPRTRCPKPIGNVCTSRFSHSRANIKIQLEPSQMWLMAPTPRGVQLNLEVCVERTFSELCS